MSVTAMPTITADVIGEPNVYSSSGYGIDVGSTGWYTTTATINSESRTVCFPYVNLTIYSSYACAQGYDKQNLESDGVTAKTASVAFLMCMTIDDDDHKFYFSSRLGTFAKPSGYAWTLSLSEFYFYADIDAQVDNIHISILPLWTIYPKSYYSASSPSTYKVAYLPETNSSDYGRMHFVKVSNAIANYRTSTNTIYDSAIENYSDYIYSNSTFGYWYTAASDVPFTMNGLPLEDTSTGSFCSSLASLESVGYIHSNAKGWVWVSDDTSPTSTTSYVVVPQDFVTDGLDASISDLNDRKRIENYSIMPNIHLWDRTATTDSYTQYDPSLYSLSQFYVYGDPRANMASSSSLMLPLSNAMGSYMYDGTTLADHRTVIDYGRNWSVITESYTYGIHTDTFTALCNTSTGVAFTNDTPDADGFLTSKSWSDVRKSYNWLTDVVENDAIYDAGNPNAFVATNEVVQDAGYGWNIVGQLQNGVFVPYHYSDDNLNQYLFITPDGHIFHLDYIYSGYTTIPSLYMGTGVTAEQMYGCYYLDEDETILYGLEPTYRYKDGWRFFNDYLGNAIFVSSSDTYVTKPRCTSVNGIEEPTYAYGNNLSYPGGLIKICKPMLSKGTAYPTYAISQKDEIEDIVADLIANS